MRARWYHVLLTSEAVALLACLVYTLGVWPERLRGEYHPEEVDALRWPGIGLFALGFALFWQVLLVTNRKARVATLVVLTLVIPVGVLWLTAMAIASEQGQ